MKSFDEQDTSVTQEEAVTAICRAGAEIMPLAVICCRDQLRAEAISLDVLLVSLETGWFCHSINWGDEFTHMEFREDIFTLMWKRICNEKIQGLSGGLTENYGESEMRYYQLDMRIRVMLYLRTKIRFTFEQIARIMDEDSSEKIEVEMNQVRSELLGRDLEASLRRVL